GLGELGHRGGQLRHGGGHLDAVLGEHALVVVDGQVLSVVGYAVPVARAHHALGVVLRGDLQVGPEQLVPAVLGRLRREVGEQALLGQQPGGRVALVVLHDVGDVGGVEDHRGVLLHLVEALQRELHRHAGVLFLEVGDRLVPGDLVGASRPFVQPDLEYVRRRRGTSAATAAAAGGQAARQGYQGRDEQAR